MTVDSQTKRWLPAVLPAVLLSLLPMTGVGQITPPPRPVDGPGDPPLLPAHLRDTPGGRPGQPEPPAPGGLQIVPEDIPGGAPRIAEPVDGIAAVEQRTARPELIIEAGGFLGAVTDVAISADSRWIAASGDKVVRLIDAASGAVIKTLRGDRLRTSYGNTNGVAFSPDGQYLLVGVHDDGPHGSVRVYRMDNPDVIHQLLPGMNAPCLHLRFSRDGRYLATSDTDGQIYLWDWPARRILSRIPCTTPDKPIIDVLEFPTDDAFLLAVKHDGPYVYHVPDGREVAAQDQMPPRLLGWMFDTLKSNVTWPFDMKDPPRTFTTQIERGIWGAAGMGTSSGRSKPWVSLYRSREAYKTYPAPPTLTYQGHRWEVLALAISPNREFVVSGDKFGEVHIWDADTGRDRFVIAGQGESIYQAAFTQTNDQIVFATRPDLSNWTFNRYGVADRMIDLSARNIRSVQGGRAIEEITQTAAGTAGLQAPGAGEQSFSMTMKFANRQTRYRIPSGRIPSCYTLLDSARLGVSTPLLFADNLGFLALWNTSRDDLRRAFSGHDSMVTSISPAPNGRIFVTGSTDRTIRIWSLENYTPTGIFDFRYENSTVISVRPGTSSMNAGVQRGDMIVALDGHSLDEMYEMMLYDRFPYQPGQTVTVTMKRGQREFRYPMKLDPGFDYVQPLLNVFIGDHNQWIIWSPEGYYDCSPGADQLIGWHVNQGPDQAARFYRAQQFRKQLYRPDLIDQIIRTGVAVAGSDIDVGGVAPGVDLSDREDFAASAPPEVTILSPQSGDSGGDPRVTIEATAVATNELAIARVTLLHNGVPAKVFRPRDASESRQLEISHRLRLFPGRNEISLIAENRIATSSAQECQVVLTAPATQRKSDVYVLAVGVSGYQNAGANLSNLKYADRDARQFAEAVRQHTDGRLYNTVETSVLTNEQATRDGILDGLEWLADNVQQGDVVMFFCSGHGFLDDRENFYLGSFEANPQRLRSSAVSWREVVRTLHEDLPACRRLVFLDACHADGIAAGAQNPLQELAAPELGTVFYASCTLQQQSFENDDWQHGAFTRAILDLLGDRAADVSPQTGDGLVSTVEMALGVTDRVSAMTGDRQNPVVYSPPRLERVNILEFQD